MRIELGRGLDSIAFGASRDSLVTTFGQPDRVFVNPYWEDDDSREEYEYWNLRTSFRMYDDDRLGWIETQNCSARLLDQPVIDRNIDDVVGLMQSAGYGSPDVDDYGSFLSYCWESCWLELEVVYGRVARLKLGVPFANDKEYAWPDSVQGA